MSRKMKTRKSSAKRFRITGSGKIVFYGAGHSHHLEKRNSLKKKRQNSKKVLDSTNLKSIKSTLPYLD